jgi:sec-independent protein translocase protein TatB
MFPTGFSTSHMVVILAIALIVVGPKNLPKMLRQVGQFVGRMRSMANDFRTSFEDMARQSELEELRKEVEAMRSQTQGIADQANEIVQSAALEHDPMYDVYDPMGLHGGGEAAPIETAAAEAAPAKPKRVRKKPAAEAAPEAAPIVSDKPVRRRKAAPKDIVA